ncbi:DUF2330 domain-containing protein [bacterium]|nr:DUF2330 domain-containing protein [bacterium]
MLIQNLKKLSYIFVIFSILSSFLIVNPVEGCACGMLFAENDREIEMAGEQGLVIFDKNDQKEQMAIYFEMSGNSNNSALVVPTPEKSDISQIKKEVFSDLKYLLYPPNKTTDSIGALPGDSGVEVLERKEVGNFEIAALKANSYQDLISWTKENGFELSPKAEKATNLYITNEFVLNVIKLKKNADKSEINPLLFSFKTNKLFYPIMEFEDDNNELKDTSLTLYLLTDEKIDIPGTDIRNKQFSKDDLEYSITTTDDKDFTNLEFASNNYYISTIRTNSYSGNDNLKVSLANPSKDGDGKTNPPLESTPAREDNTLVYVGIAIIISFFTALTVMAIKRKNKN